MIPRLIRALTFNNDGSVTIEYVTPSEDFKANGLALNHAILVPAGEDYDDEIEAAREAALALLIDALFDLAHLGPYQAPVATEDNDDE